MFEVTALSPDGEWIDVRPSAARLRGAIVGREVPPFGWASMSGELITNASYRGKFLLLDVWSPT